MGQKTKPVITSLNALSIWNAAHAAEAGAAIAQGLEPADAAILETGLQEEGIGGLEIFLAHPDRERIFQQVRWRLGHVRFFGNPWDWSPRPEVLKTFAVVPPRPASSIQPLIGLESAAASVGTGAPCIEGGCLYASGAGAVAERISVPASHGPYSSMGEVIRRRRIEKGWSQNQLGRKVGVSGSEICFLELGERPGLKHLIKVEKVLDIRRGALRRLLVQIELQLSPPRGPYAPVGWAVRARRIFHGLTRKELADKVGCSKVEIGQIESGRQRGLSYLETIEKVLNIYPRALRRLLARVELKLAPPRGLYAPLGHFLKTRRIWLGLMQTELAHQARVPEATVAAIELGNRPGNSAWDHLEKALHLQPGTFQRIWREIELARLPMYRRLYSKRGRAIAIARLQQGLDQSELAGQVGIPKSTLSQIESGAKPGDKHLAKIAQALGLDLDSLTSL